MHRLIILTLLFCGLVSAQQNKIVVTGAVNSPGVYPMVASGITTLSIAIAQAGGVIPTFEQTAFIYRTDDKGQLHEIQVPVKKVLDHEAPDIPLNPRDVVYVPEIGKDQPAARDR